jgi:hypothetical protein
VPKTYAVIGKGRSAGRSIRSNNARRCAIPPHRPCIELGDKLADPRIELIEGEERVFSQAREDPSLNDLDRDLDFRLVARFSRSSRNNGRTIVLGQVLVGPLECRFVPRGARYAAFELVGDEGRRDSAKERERADVA